MKTPFIILTSAFLLILSLASIGCDGNTPVPTPTLKPMPSPTISATPTPAPTPTIITTAIGNCTVYDSYITKGNITLEYYSEAYVLSNLLSQSTPFKKFYYEKCGNISGKIRWCLYPGIQWLWNVPPKVIISAVPIKEVHT